MRHFVAAEALVFHLHSESHFAFSSRSGASLYRNSLDRRYREQDGILTSHSDIHLELSILPHPSILSQWQLLALNIEKVLFHELQAEEDILSKPQISGLRFVCRAAPLFRE